jgi:hypothetical protein
MVKGEQPPSEPEETESLFVFGGPIDKSPSPYLAWQQPVPEEETEDRPLFDLEGNIDPAEHDEVTPDEL